MYPLIGFIYLLIGFIVLGAVIWNEYKEYKFRTEKRIKYKVSLLDFLIVPPVVFFLWPLMVLWFREEITKYFDNVEVFSNEKVLEKKRQQDIEKFEKKNEE